MASFRCTYDKAKQHIKHVHVLNEPRLGLIHCCNVCLLVHLELRGCTHSRKFLIATYCGIKRVPTLQHVPEALRNASAGMVTDVLGEIVSRPTDGCIKLSFSPPSTIHPQVTTFYAGLNSRECITFSAGLNNLQVHQVDTCIRNDKQTSTYTQIVPSKLSAICMQTFSSPITVLVAKCPNENTNHLEGSIQATACQL